MCLWLNSIYFKYLSNANQPRMEGPVWRQRKSENSENQKGQIPKILYNPCYLAQLAVVFHQLSLYLLFEKASNGENVLINWLLNSEPMGSKLLNICLLLLLSVRAENLQQRTQLCSPARSNQIYIMVCSVGGLLVTKTDISSQNQSIAISRIKQARRLIFCM